MTAVLHLVTGSTGAGKTTYATNLAVQECGIRLSIDEWMTTLFSPDQPEQPDFGWMMERVSRCEAQMWTVAREAIARGVAVIVDCGLTRADHRAKWASYAAKAGSAVQLHYLDVDSEERWKRVQRRNMERGPTFRLEVTRAMFDFIEGMWEPPTDAELAAMNGVHVRGTQSVC